MPLYYKTEKFSILEFGWERYEKTEDKSKGITWALLVEKETEKKIAVLNTHLWWKQGSEHDALRVINAKQLFAKMKYLKEKYSCPVFAFGDFNAIEGKQNLQKVFEKMNSKYNYLFYEITTIDNKKCDNIILPKNLAVKNKYIVKNTDISDHYLCVAEIE